MTFKQIEKEFDELWGTDSVGECWNDPDCSAEQLKSFLKQSFIKYLQEQEKVFDNIAYNNHYFVCKDCNSELIFEEYEKHLQAQIKQIEG